MYRFRWNEPGVIRISDNAVIPPDPGGVAWREYMEWMYAGGEALPAIEPPVLSRKLAKYKIVERLTDDELEAFRVAKTTLPARLLFLWEEAHNNEVNADDPRLIEAFTSIIGATRTQEVLS